MLFRSISSRWRPSSSAIASAISGSDCSSEAANMASASAALDGSVADITLSRTLSQCPSPSTPVYSRQAWTAKSGIEGSPKPQHLAMIGWQRAFRSTPLCASAKTTLALIYLSNSQRSALSYPSPASGGGIRRKANAPRALFLSHLSPRAGRGEAKLPRAL